MFVAVDVYAPMEKTDAMWRNFRLNDKILCFIKKNLHILS